MLTPDPALGGPLRLLLRGGPRQVAMGGFHVFNRSETDWDLFHPVFLLDEPTGRWKLDLELERIAQVHEGGEKMASLKGYTRRLSFLTPAEGLRLPVVLGGVVHYADTDGFSNLDNQHNSLSSTGRGAALSVGAAPNDTYSVGVYFGSGESVSKGVSDFFLDNSLFNAAPSVRIGQDNYFRGAQMEIRVDERTWLGVRREKAVRAFRLQVAGDGAFYALPFRNYGRTGELTLRHNIGPRFTLLVSISRSYGHGVDTMEYNGLVSADDQQLSWMENHEAGVTVQWRRHPGSILTLSHANSYGSLQLSGFINPFLLDQLTFAQCRVVGCGFVYNIRARYSRRTWQLGYEKKSSQRTTLRLGLSASPVRATGAGYGVEQLLFGLLSNTVNENRSRLTLASWTVYGVTLGFEHRTRGGWLVEYALAQLIPVGDKREPEEQGLDDPFTTPEGVKRTADGGRLHVLSISGPVSFAPRWEALAEIPRGRLDADLSYTTRSVTPPSGFTGAISEQSRGLRLGIADRVTVLVEDGLLKFNENDFDAAAESHGWELSVAAARYRGTEFSVNRRRTVIKLGRFYDWLTFQHLDGPRCTVSEWGLGARGRAAGLDWGLSWSPGRLASSIAARDLDYDRINASLKRRLGRRLEAELEWERTAPDRGGARAGLGGALEFASGRGWGVRLEAGHFPQGTAPGSRAASSLAASAFMAAADNRGGYGPIMAAAMDNRVWFAGLSGFYRYEF